MPRVMTRIAPLALLEDVETFASGPNGGWPSWSANRGSEVELTPASSGP